jgi:hypothetical protein
LCRRGHGHFSPGWRAATICPENPRLNEGTYRGSTHEILSWGLTDRPPCGHPSASQGFGKDTACLSAASCVVRICRRPRASRLPCAWQGLGQDIRDRAGNKMFLGTTDPPPCGHPSALQGFGKDAVCLSAAWCVVRIWRRPRASRPPCAWQGLGQDILHGTLRFHKGHEGHRGSPLYWEDCSSDIPASSPKHDTDILIDRVVAWRPQIPVDSAKFAAVTCPGSLLEVRGPHGKLQGPGPRGPLHAIAWGTWILDVELHGHT